MCMNEMTFVNIQPAISLIASHICPIKGSVMIRILYTSITFGTVESGALAARKLASSNDMCQSPRGL